MTLIKKTSELWTPSENPGLQIGDTVEVTNPDLLVKSGMAVLVDMDGNELEMPGQNFVCPVCFQKKDGLSSFVKHVTEHLKKPIQKKTDELTPDEKEKRALEIKAKRVEALKKARKKRKENLAKKKDGK